MCGEHKESGILRHGCFASPFCKDTGLSQVEEKLGSGELVLNVKITNYKHAQFSFLS